MSTLVESSSGWNLPPRIENNNYKLQLSDKQFEESPAWSFHLLQACSHHLAQWFPTFF